MEARLPLLRRTRMNVRLAGTAFDIFSAKRRYGGHRTIEAALRLDHCCYMLCIYVDMPSAHFRRASASCWLLHAMQTAHQESCYAEQETFCISILEPHCVLEPLIKGSTRDACPRCVRYLVRCCCHYADKYRSSTRPTSCCCAYCISINFLPFLH